MANEPLIRRFLLAKFHMDALAKKHNLRQVRKALLDLPEEINETYDDAMKRIFDQHKDSSQLAIRALSWIVCAKRPLKIGELLEALAVDLDDKEYDEEAMFHQDLVLSVCAGLVTIEKETDLVRLVHYTTQQYLELKRETLFRDADNDLANTCLIYLNHAIVDSARPQSESSYDGTSFMELAQSESSCDTASFLDYALSESAFDDPPRREYTQCEIPCPHQATSFLEWVSLPKFETPFLEYAHTHLEIHLVRATEEAILDSALSYLKLDPKVKYDFARRSVYIKSTIHFIWMGSHDFTSLALASRLGLYKVAEALIAWGVNVNAVTAYESRMRDTYRERHTGTALHVAVFYGHRELVELLLASGAYLNTPHMHNSALHCAVEKGEEPMIRLLIDRGASLESTDELGQTPFHLAVCRGSKHIAGLLLDKGAYIETEVSDKTRSRPLHLVEHISTACWLLDHGAQIDARDAEGYTPLLRLILERDSGKFSPLMNAMKVLILQGADIRATTDMGLGALSNRRYSPTTAERRC